MVYSETNRQSDLQTPNPRNFRAGYKSFRTNESRGAMYKVATFLISHFWGKYSEMADGLGVLLLTWNQACYRYGSFSFDKLEECLRSNWKTIERFRESEIFCLSELDKNAIVKLFEELLEALKIAEGKSKGNKSPVAVAKALHLLAPKLFPLWDDKIAKAYKCHYAKKPAAKYFLFCDKMKTVAEAVRNYDNIPKDVTILKLIDEYNYAKYTKKWI